LDWHGSDWCQPLPCSSCTGTWKRT
jgi:hypothetical protein